MTKFLLVLFTLLAFFSPPDASAGWFENMKEKVGLSGKPQGHSKFSFEDHCKEKSQAEINEDLAIAQRWTGESCVLNEKHESQAAAIVVFCGKSLMPFLYFSTKESCESNLKVKKVVMVPNNVSKEFEAQKWFDTAFSTSLEGDCFKPLSFEEWRRWATRRVYTSGSEESGECTVKPGKGNDGGLALTLNCFGVKSMAFNSKKTCHEVVDYMNNYQNSK